MSRSSREVMADALERIDERFERIEKLLEDIKGIIVKTVDDQNEQRHWVRDQFDRLGTRVHELERKLANGGE